MVHDKIVSFLPPQENLKLVHGRDALVENMFGKQKKLSAELKKVMAGKKRKAQAAMAVFANEEEKDDIVLI